MRTLQEARKELESHNTISYSNIMFNFVEDRVLCNLINEVGHFTTSYTLYQSGDDFAIRVLPGTFTKTNECGFITINDNKLENNTLDVTLNEFIEALKDQQLFLEKC